MNEIERLALDYHKTVEGEYGCPGLECPGVHRLIKFAESVAALRAPSPVGELIDKWKKLEAEQMQWSRESDAKQDGANSHAERARARIYRECAADLSALSASQEKA